MGMWQWATRKLADLTGDVAREMLQEGAGQQAHARRKATAKREKGTTQQVSQRRGVPARQAVPAGWYRQPRTDKQLAAIRALDPNAAVPTSKGAASDLLARLGAKPIAVQQQVPLERRDRAAADLDRLHATRKGRPDVEAGGAAAVVIGEYKTLRAAQQAEHAKPPHRQDQSRITALRREAARLEAKRKGLWEEARRDAHEALQRAYRERPGSPAYRQHLRAADRYRWQAEVLSRNNL